MCAEIDKFLIVLLIYTINIISLLQKFLFSSRCYAYFFATMRGRGTSFQVTIIVEFFNEICSFVI